MKIKASFLTADDCPPDLFLAFVQGSNPVGVCKSLILMRTKKYEKFLDEIERGVSISWEDDVEEPEFDEIITSFEWNKTQAIITSPQRTFEVDISDIQKEELKGMEKILKKMNSDRCFTLKKI
jgi:hypothetical protein